MPKILIIMGSGSDLNLVEPCMETLKELNIPFRATVSSAHRTPERTDRIIRDAEAEGAAIFICAAGMAAHLAGAVAARTIKPVIAIPILGKSLCGMDALFSTVQMPSGFPAATMSINGAKNAALLAAQILALEDADLAIKLQNLRKEMKEEVERVAAAIQRKWT